MSKYERLKKKVEDAQREADQAEGAIGVEMKQLKDRFNCSTLGEAKREYKRLVRESEKAKAAFETAEAQFEDNWSDELD
jgi:hypothetical protein